MHSLSAIAFSVLISRSHLSHIFSKPYYTELNILQRIECNVQTTEADSFLISATTPAGWTE